MSKPTKITDRERGRQEAIRLSITVLASLLPVEEAISIFAAIKRTSKTPQAKRSYRIMDLVLKILQHEDELKEKKIL